MYQPKAVVFCLSYLNIPITHTIIDKYSYDNTLIVTHSNGIRNYYLDMFPKMKVLTIVRPQISMHPKSIIDILRTKRLWRKYINRISDYDVYFFFVAHAIFESYLITLLERNNRLFYKPAVKVKYGHMNRTIKNRLANMAIHVLFGIDVQYEDSDEGIFPYVTSKYLNGLHLHRFNYPFNATKIESLIINRYCKVPGGVLLPAGGLSKNIQENMVEYRSKNNTLIQLVEQIVPGTQIYVKCHPRFNDLISKEKQLNQIDSYIPGNLIISGFKVVIGYSSGLIFEAANRNIIGISTIDYFALEEKSLRERRKKYLNDNLDKDKCIHYVTSLDDLRNILHGIYAK
jgi:hypothetical protein